LLGEQVGDFEGWSAAPDYGVVAGGAADEGGVAADGFGADPVGVGEALEVERRAERG
jgi:hypothetical protein